MGRRRRPRRRPIAAGQVKRQETSIIESAYANWTLVVFAAAEPFGWLASHLYLVIPLLPGFWAVHRLLPQGTRRPLGPAVGVGVVSLLLVWMSWMHETGGPLYNFLFTLFADISIVSAVCMISQTNPVYAALMFAMVILGTCGLFLLLSAPFLAVATIIVYAGAIIVTFLFVIMLAQQSGMASYDRHSQSPLAASLGAFLLLGGLLYTFDRTYPTEREQADMDERLTTLQEVFRRLDDLEANVTKLAVDRKTPGASPASVGGILREHAQKIPADSAHSKAKDRLESALANWDQGVRAGGLKDRIGELRAVASEIHQGAKTQIERQGFLAPPSGLRPNELSAPGAAPLGQTAGLGRSLFGQYLWAVEIAGTLLLVAVIGAVAIAPSRAGGSA